MCGILHTSFDLEFDLHSFLSEFWKNRQCYSMLCEIFPVMLR